MLECNQDVLDHNVLYDMDKLYILIYLLIFPNALTFNYDVLFYINFYTLSLLYNAFHYLTCTILGSVISAVQQHRILINVFISNKYYAYNYT